MIKYNPEITLGSIAETVSVILAVGGLAIMVSNKLAIHDEKLTYHDKEIQRIETQAVQDVGKLQASQTEIRTQLRSDLKDLSSDIKELDRKVSANLLDHVLTKSRSR